MPEAEDFREALHSMFRIAENEGKSSITITSGELHRRVGGYPGHNHRMPVCCSVMYQELRNIVSDFESGSFT